MNGQIDNSFQRPLTGTINAVNGTVDISSPNQATETIQLAGTWVGTIVLEASNDGTTYYTIPEINDVNGLNVLNATGNGIFLAQTNGFAYVRVRASAWTSGTVIVTVYGSDAASFVSAISLLRGSTDGTMIGNVGDRLKVDASLSSGSVTITTLAAACNIIKQNEISVTVKVETDLPSSTYTVPAGKSFNLVSAGGSFDAQQPMYLRLKKQTIYNWLHQRKITGIKVGGVWRFERKEVDVWLKSMRRLSNKDQKSGDKR